MIKVTRFNHSELMVNADLIEFVEDTPDTVITMLTGRKVLVLEPVEEVVARIKQYRREVGMSLHRLEGAEAAPVEYEEPMGHPHLADRTSGRAGIRIEHGGGA